MFFFSFFLAVLLRCSLTKAFVHGACCAREEEETARVQPSLNAVPVVVLPGFVLPNVHEQLLHIG